MTIHPANNEQYLLVTVPEGAKPLYVDTNCLGPHICLEPGNQYIANLPDGNWQLIGVASSLTDEEKEVMVEQVEDWPVVIYYNYTRKGCHHLHAVQSAYKDPLNSFASLLRHYNLVAITTVILKKNK